MRGFATLLGINAAVALIPPLVLQLLLISDLTIFVIWFLFPVLPLAWSIPMIVGARRAGRHQYARGLMVAAAVTMLGSSACVALA